MSEHSDEMTYDEAIEALQGADEADRADADKPLDWGREASAESSTPEGSAPTPPQAAQSEQESFTRADLESLLDGVNDPASRDRITRAYKSFQGDYTRKTQELAERSKQYEEFGDPNAVREALELQQALRDPQNWPQVHAELTEALENLGMSPAAAMAEAASTMEAAAEQPRDDGGRYAAKPDLSDMDPDFEPVKAYVEQLESRLDAFEATVQAERDEAEKERYRNALIGELNRQESTIRQTHPEYDEDDIAAIYEVSSYHDGNLFNAQESYEQSFRRRLSKYLDAKQGVVDTPGIHPLPGAGVASEHPTDYLEMSDKDVDALAKEYIDAFNGLENF